MTQCMLSSLYTSHREFTEPQEEVSHPPLVCGRPSLRKIHLCSNYNTWNGGFLKLWGRREWTSKNRGKKRIVLGEFFTRLHVKSRDV